MILCLDLETTGLNEQRCGILQIGATWLHSGESFFRDCQPDANCLIEDRALEVNGIPKDQIFTSGCVWEKIAIVEFLGWVRGSHGENAKIQVAAWNAHFDFRHLQAALDRAGVPSQFRLFTHRLIDVHSAMAVDQMRKKVDSPWPQAHQLAMFGNEIPSADAGSNFLGLSPEVKPHNALNGAKQVRAMLRRMLGDAGAMP